MNKRPRGIKDHHPHVNNKFLTVWGVSFKHKGLIIVAIGPGMYRCQSPFFWTPLKQKLKCHHRIYLKSILLERCLLSDIKQGELLYIWGWTQKEYAALVSLAMLQRWVWELWVGCILPVCQPDHHDPTGVQFASNCILKAHGDWIVCQHYETVWWYRGQTSITKKWQQENKNFHVRAAITILRLPVEQR